MRKQANRRALLALASAMWCGAAGFSGGLAAAWVGLAWLHGRGGLEALAVRRLGVSPVGAVTALAATMGVPLDWRLRLLGVGGHIEPLGLLAQRPLPLLCPLLAALALGWCTAVAARRTGLPRRALLPAAGASFAAMVAGSALLASWLGRAAAVAVTVRPGAALALAAVWAMVGGCLGLALHTVLAAPWSAMAPRGARRRALAAALVVSLAVLVPAATPAASAATGPRGGRQAAGTPAPIGYQRKGVAPALAELRRQGGSVFAAVSNPWRGTPSSLAAHSPLGAGAGSWLRAHAGLFGVADPAGMLRRTRSVRDGLGQRHLWFDQVIMGVPVYKTRVGVHLDRSGRFVQGVSNGLRPDLVVGPARPTLSAGAAVAAARRALPSGTLAAPARLYWYAADPSPGASRPATLVWMVELSDLGRHLSNAYFVDARSAGTIVHVEEGGEQARVRWVIDAQHGQPGPLPPARREGDPPSSINDVNAAYDWTGATYDYYKAMFGRDSYDDLGGSLVSYVRIGQNFQNAYWDDAKLTMNYGDRMATTDITGHELTHGVDQFSANLDYSLQSGALNESFSDDFGEMVERRARGSNDWLLGEGSALGVMRSMANPPQYGDPKHPDPDHLDDWLNTCGDHGGVHTNSGIPNKAFYLLATAPGVGPDKAARIFYRALTQYLWPSAGFNDARHYTWIAARDLYGKGSDEGLETLTAWTSVGVDGVKEPPRNNCACLLDTALNGAGLRGLERSGPDAGAIRAALYRTRDVEAVHSPALDHYRRVYEANTGRMSDLALVDEALRQRTAAVTQDLTPLLDALATPQGDTVAITTAQVDEVDAILDAYAAADLAHGGSSVADAIAHERSLVDLDQLAGRTVNQALAWLDQQLPNG